MFTNEQKASANSTNPDGIVMFMPIFMNDKGEFNSELHSTATRTSGGCFPYNAIVKTPKGYKTCSDLSIGDYVLTGYKNNKRVYEPILFFGHREYADYLGIEIVMENNKSVCATGSHCIYIYNESKELVRFSDVRIGDYVKYKNVRVKVTKINQIVQQGVISPLTKSCKIVVNHVQASCITDELTKQSIYTILKMLDATGYRPSTNVAEPIRFYANKVKRVLSHI